MNACKHTHEEGHVWIGITSPPPYECSFCEMERLQSEVAAARARSAELQAEVKRLREALVELLLQANKTGITYEPLVEAVYEARHVLSQSPTPEEKKT